MRISYDQKYLFTASKDGTLLICEIKDRGNDGPAVRREFPGILTFSDEIMVEKSDMEEFYKIKEALENENQAATDNAVDSKMGNNQ
jgi:hypothetical protein